jgi:hypothetical protein
MSCRFLAASVLISILTALPGLSQTLTVKNPTAASLLGSAIKTMTQGVPVSDATLTGTATRTYGSDVQTGSVTLQALGGTAGRISLELSDGSQSEIINQLQGAPAGQWAGPDGTVHAMATHDCWVPANWFFPPLALAEALNDPSVAVADVGQETSNGEAVEHLRFWRVVASHASTPQPIALITQLSAVDVYLDAANALPVALDFNIHPESNAGVDLQVEIRFSNYQQVSGLLLPMHLGKFVDGSEVLDLNLAGVSLNTGLLPSEFAVSAASGGQQ